MDDADIAGARQEAEMARKLKAAHEFAPEAQPTGFCLNCGEPLQNDRRWCGPECREDWERRRTRGQS